MRWRLAGLAALVVATVPAAALGGGHRFPVPPWMQDQAPPETQRMMQTPQMRQMMAEPALGMDRMMNSRGMQKAAGKAPQGMEQMTQSTGMQWMMNGGGSGH